MKYVKYFLLPVLALNIVHGFFNIYLGLNSWFYLICNIINIASFVLILRSFKPEEPEWVSRKMEESIDYSDLMEFLKHNKAIEFKFVNPKEVE
jgi:hypothetical protein